MKRIALSALLSVMVVVGLVFTACGKKEKEVPIYYLYQDIYGHANFERDGIYPPPANLDLDRDELIVVMLHFGEAFAGGSNAGGFDKDQIYGYYITTDDIDVNFIFPFVPSGKYWMSAELVVNDSCYFDKTALFDHKSDEPTSVQLRPSFLGVGRGCFDLILSSAPEEPVDYVQHGTHFWVNKKVYDALYKESKTGKDLIQP